MAWGDSVWKVNEQLRARLAEVEARLELMTREARLSREATERAVARLAEVEAELERVCAICDKETDALCDSEIRAGKLQARLAAVLALCDTVDEFGTSLLSTSEVRAAATGEGDR